ncbi:sugar ABC transporter substrate-binding protein [Pseudonocardia acaciae]|uniref:sugar ABC transporter substrate-binding protein n=1 Tax=Pseudonocardia acaciae TaxID=551276 RepID=UPI0014705939|nr:sugar ABC transporter substrate-binding protein [Pseudonocardia acaciae]
MALLTACGGGGQAGAPAGGGKQPVPAGTVDFQGKTFAFAIATAANPLIVSQGETFKQQAEKLGAKVTIYDNKGTAEAMLSNANLMVAAKPDVIVEYPSAADATSRVSQTFKRSGIPCISVNVPVEGCPLFNFDQPYLAGLGAEAMAKQMAARGWTGENTTVVIGQAAKYGPSVNIAVTSFYDKLSGLVPGMTHVPSRDITPSTTTIGGEQGLQVDLDFTADIAYPAMTRALQSIPANRHIVLYTTADDVTVAARRAIENAGRTRDAIVSGFGGNGDAVKALRANDGWVTEQTGFYAHWGEFVLAMVAAVQQGATLPELTSPPMVVLTKDNVDTYFTPGTTDLALMPELPANSRYLTGTGVLQKYANVTGAK